MYEMFMGPIDSAKPWDENGIDGSKKFLDRVWRLYVESGKISDEENKNLEKVYHQTVKKVSNDFENMDFNTAIAQMLIFINSVYKEEVFPREYAEGFIKLLNPVCPHITEELWNSVLKNNGSIAYEKWPEYDEAKTIDDEVEIHVQVNGKVKAVVVAPKGASQEEVKKLVDDNEVIRKLLEGKTIVKEIYVGGKIYNIVVK